MSASATISASNTAAESSSDSAINSVENINSIEEQPRIVSVNSRGGESSRIAGKLVVAILALATLVIGVAYSVNRYRAARASEAAKAEQVQQGEKRPAAPANRRVFNSDPPALPQGAMAGSGMGAAAIAMQTAAPDPRCGDGSASHVPRLRRWSSAGSRLR